jgi:hypothetical protein
MVVHIVRPRAKIGRNRDFLRLWVPPSGISEKIKAGLASASEGRNHDDQVTCGGAMSECEDLEPSRGRANVVAFAAPNNALAANIPIGFNRQELNEILKVYGRMVAEGEWRDYAIDHLKEKAVFSVFRRATEVPLFRIEKQPKLARRQGAYSVIAPAGLILKRGHDLATVLRIFDQKMKLVVA